MFIFLFSFVCLHLYNVVCEGGGGGRRGAFLIKYILSYLILLLTLMPYSTFKIFKYL